MDPTGWLQSIGLERYAAAFRENEKAVALEKNDV
jgi:hypothetical protein